MTPVGSQCPLFEPTAPGGLNTYIHTYIHTYIYTYARDANLISDNHVDLDSDIAKQLDQITLHFLSKWIETSLMQADVVRTFSYITNSRFGFLSATYRKDATLIANWAQVAPSILRQFGLLDMAILLAQIPATLAQLRRSICSIAAQHLLTQYEKN